MSNETPEYYSIFSPVFEPALLAELEAKSMIMMVSGGETIMRIGSPVRAVPMVISGIVKVSRINEEGQEILLYYVRRGETCAMSFTCWMTSQVSSIEGVAEEDLCYYISWKT